MTKLKLLTFFLVLNIASHAQDLIIKKNGDEIKSKVLEVALTIIKYKKFDNPNGPSFEILKSEVFMIKYENGTKDLLNPIEEKKQPTVAEKDLSTLAFTDKHRSISIAYGLSALFGGISNYGDGTSNMVIGPLVLSFDKALSNKFSIAFRPAVMYYQSNISSYNFKYTSNQIYAGLQVRIDYHFATTNKIDPYFGIGGGIGHFFGNNGIHGSYPNYGGNFGIKAYGKGSNAFLVELGYDSYSYLKIGYVFGRHK